MDVLRHRGITIDETSAMVAHFEDDIRVSGRLHNKAYLRLLLDLAPESFPLRFVIKGSSSFDPLSNFRDHSRLQRRGVSRHALALAAPSFYQLEQQAEIRCSPQVLISSRIDAASTEVVSVATVAMKRQDRREVPGVNGHLKKHAGEDHGVILSRSTRKSAHPGPQHSRSSLICSYNVPVTCVSSELRGTRDYGHR
jgi:hypothetical protein